MFDEIVFCILNSLYKQFIKEIALFQNQISQDICHWM